MIVPIISHALMSDSSAMCCPGGMDVVADFLSHLIEAVVEFAAPKCSGVMPGKYRSTNFVLMTFLPLWRTHL
jgi:hypothetical protein